MILVAASCIGPSEVGSESSGSEGHGSTGSGPATTEVESDSEDTTATSSGGATPIEQAALEACAALETTEATPLPSGMGAFLDNGFRMGNDFPYRFRLDSTSPNVAWRDGDYTCWDVSAPQEEVEDYWFGPDGWIEEDGEIHVHMATQGIDAVIYYGSDESFGDVPGSPMTASIAHDVSALCPELPWIWLPDPAGYPENARRVCMRHTEPVAEAVFVRIP